MLYAVYKSFDLDLIMQIYFRLNLKITIVLNPIWILAFWIKLFSQTSLSTVKFHILNNFFLY